MILQTIRHTIREILRTEPWASVVSFPALHMCVAGGRQANLTDIFLLFLNPCKKMQGY